MRATACAALLALVVSGCGTSVGAQHGAKTEHPAKHLTGGVRVHAWLEGGPLDPKTHRSMLDHKPVRNVRFSVTSPDGRHWHGRTTARGIRTFRLPPGRYVVTSDWCGARRAEIKVLPERVIPVRYACPVP
jgi:hypothetical protein